MPWHPVASGMCARTVNAADGVGSWKHEPRTHPAHADGRFVYNGADRDGQNGNPSSKLASSSAPSAASSPVWRRSGRPKALMGSVSR
jgi:hypothetical protein